MTGCPAELRQAGKVWAHTVHRHLVRGG
jgi:hypothetical protein